MRSINLYHNLSNIYIARNFDLITEAEFRDLHRRLSNEAEATDDPSSDADRGAAGLRSDTVLLERADGIER